MENIKIYHSYGKSPIVTAICFIVAGLCNLILLILEGSHNWISWLIVFLLLGFGLYQAYLYWKEKIKKTPFLEVADDKVTVKSAKSWEINFSEVEEFFFTDITKQLIGIHYKNDAEAQKLENARGIENTARKMNKMLVGAQEGIPSYRLSIKPQELLDLLNQRLEAYRSTHA